MDHQTLSALLPELNFSQSSRALGSVPSSLGPLHKRRMLEDGHFPVPPLPSETDDLRRALANGIELLAKAGIPPSFVYCSDEAWALAEHFLAYFPSSHNLTGDFLAWRVEAGNAGFAPHRDRQPDNVKASFDETGYPLYSTIWYALSPVSSENSCLFFVNATVDPGYLEGDPLEEDSPSPMQRALDSKEAFQSIRACTGGPGSAWCFSHRTLHWGSRNPIHSTSPPRVSMSFVASDARFEPAYLVNPTVVPSFDVRLALMCGQMICYHEHFPAPDASTLKFYFESFQKHLPSFSESYMQKVYVEFASAVRALAVSDDDQLQDMAQTAMLDSGWLFFHDDFAPDEGLDGDGGENLNVDEEDENNDDDDDAAGFPDIAGDIPLNINDDDDNDDDDDGNNVSKSSSGRKKKKNSNNNNNNNKQEPKSSSSQPSSGRRSKKQKQ